MDMKEKMGLVVTAGILAVSSMTTGAMADTSTAAVTQGDMIQALLQEYNQLPSWPGYPNGKPGVGLSGAFPGAWHSTYPRLLHMTTSSPSAAVTAGQLADWIATWALAARNVPPASAWAAKTNFTMLQDWGFFDGTGIKAPTDQITTAQEQTIFSHLMQAFNGIDTVNPYKQLTMQAAVQHIVQWENTIRVWPAGLNGYKVNTQMPLWGNPKQAVPESQWVGLFAVYPGVSAKSIQIQGEYTPQLPVTAGMISAWLVNFEVKARKVDLSLEPTQDPFQLLKDFSVFWHTGITSPTQQVTARQLDRIFLNMNDVTQGWRIISKSQMQFLEPLMWAEDVSIGWRGLAGSNKRLKAEWPTVYANLTHLQDSMTLTFLPGGKIVYNHAPGRGYGLGMDVAYLTPDGHVYSELWRSGGANYGKPSAFHLKYPFTYSPTSNLTSYDLNPKPHYHLMHPSDQMVGIMFTPFNQASWQEGTFIAAQPRYAVDYDPTTGHINGVMMTGVESTSYPAEVVGIGG